MKKLIALILCVLAVCSLAACGDKSTTGQKTQIPNPFVDCDTLADAAKLAGFDLTAPDSVKGYDTRTVQAIDKEMIQVIYHNGDDRLCIRKGTGLDDISGDYNSYTETNTVDVGSVQVEMKGENDTVSVAIWTNDGYSFAVNAQDAPVTSDVMRALVAGVA